ncbi:hypothetical protein LTR84_000542 [Exophiala bonariae]|uniref:Uncharacterized protein n=1 Tax=Exophiala bonariae TaxID=1690606 RepID=A0AAV9NR74_9EURO|nr:hypothetical protein LTR84_000542 [Exophiala bonariae]
MGHAGAAPSAMPYKFMNLRKISRVDSGDLIQELRRLERKTFPSSEVFPFEQSILSRQNTEVLVGLSDAPTLDDRGWEQDFWKCSFNKPVHGLAEELTSGSTKKTIAPYVYTPLLDFWCKTQLTITMLLGKLGLKCHTLCSPETDF